MKAVEEDAKERAKIKKRNEAEAEKLKGKGNHAFKEGKFTEAISHYTMAINKFNSNPVLYTNRAQVKSQTVFSNLCVQITYQILYSNILCYCTYIIANNVIGK